MELSDEVLEKIYGLEKYQLVTRDVTDLDTARIARRLMKLRGYNENHIPGNSTLMDIVTHYKEAEKILKDYGD